jgi:phytoene synthase
VDPTDASAREIVRRSGSNLACALAVLPKGRRRDMEVFYAFCRVVDDLVDEPGLEEGERRAGLARWRRLVEGAPGDPRPGLETEFAELLRRRAPNRADLLAILDGMEMDLAPPHFETAAELRRYCYHVAAAVGLVSASLFGCADPASRAYAEQLGYALQWTNILRDVGEDARAGRVFLPREDLRRFGLDEAAILSGAPDRAKFGRLMMHEAAVARGHYGEAVDVLARLPRADRRALRSAELMRRIYTGILDEMERDGFRVYGTRYRLGKCRMLGELLRAKFLG